MPFGNLLFIKNWALSFKMILPNLSFEIFALYFLHSFVHPERKVTLFERVFIPIKGHFLVVVK